MALKPMKCKEKRHSGVCKFDKEQSRARKRANVAVEKVLRVDELILRVLGRDLSLLWSR